MLVNCVAYLNGARLADIAVEDIGRYLGQPGCFVWVALCDATPEELEFMRKAFGLHELAVEDARHGEQRPKIEEYGDSLFSVMRLLDFKEGEFSVGELDVFAGHNYVLSIRNNSTRDFQVVRERCERQAGLLRQGAGFVLYALMDAVVDRYFPIIDALEMTLEEIEERIFEKGAANANVRRLYDLKHQAMQLRHAVAPLREAVGKLSGELVPELCANSREYYRDVYDHLTRINASIDAIRETIGTAIQVNLSMVTIEDNEVTKRLAAWAGIFAMATAFAGIWGMNFKEMPELGWAYGYPMALGVIVSASVILYIRFKRAGWL